MSVCTVNYSNFPPVSWFRPCSRFSVFFEIIMRLCWRFEPADSSNSWVTETNVFIERRACWLSCLKLVFNHINDFFTLKRDYAKGFSLFQKTLKITECLCEIKQVERILGPYQNQLFWFTFFCPSFIIWPFPSPLSLRWSRLQPKPPGMSSLPAAGAGTAT